MVRATQAAVIWFANSTPAGAVAPLCSSANACRQSSQPLATHLAGDKLVEPFLQVEHRGLLRCSGDVWWALQAEGWEGGVTSLAPSGLPDTTLLGVHARHRVACVKIDPACSELQLTTCGHRVAS